MATSDNLLSLTQSFMTPDSVQKFSGALGLPVEKIQSSLKSVLPTFLMGLVNKGSTSEGAESLVKMAKDQSLSGEATVNGIFGSKLSSVTSTLGSTTGMGSSSVTKIMGMIAPMAMGILGKKINQEGMSASGLMGFLGQQKSSLTSFLPTGMSSLFGIGAASAAVGSVAGSVQGGLNQTTTNIPTSLKDIQTSKNKSWVSLAVVAAVILGIIWLFSGRNPKIISPTNTVQRVSTPESGTINDSRSEVIKRDQESP